MIRNMKKTKYMGISKVGEKGQIVIPKEVRDIFGINPGDSLIVLADSKKGIALVKSDVIEAVTNNILVGTNDKDK
jgi:AbrB family looped-hinge helix DNA binding protein